LTRFHEVMAAIAEHDEAQIAALRAGAAVSRDRLTKLLIQENEPEAHTHEPIGEGHVRHPVDGRTTDTLIVPGSGDGEGNGILTPDDADRLAYTTMHPRRIDGTTVDCLAALLAHQRRLEDAIGSAAMLRPALGQLSTVKQLVREARGPA